MDNKWTTKRYLRSVNNLHLWNENPRLDPTDVYLTTKDYVEGMFRNESGCLGSLIFPKDGKALLLVIRMQ